MNKNNLEKKCFFLIALYLLINLIIRISISNALTVDESYLILTFQQFNLGYNFQPPLYNWLQNGFFSIFGLNIFALAFLKNIILFFLFFFIYKAAREIMEKTHALLSSLSLFMTYAFLWQAQKDMTHSTLIVMICAASIFVFFRLIKTEKTIYYILLGVLIACGMLSKYNYVIFVASAFIAALLVKDFRKALFTPKILLPIIISFLLFAPHFYWVVNHMEEVKNISKRITPRKGLYQTVRCLVMYFGAIGSFVGPLIGVYLLLFTKGFKKITLKNTFDQNAKSFYEKFIIVSLVMVTALIFVMRLSYFSTRWVLPYLVISPIYFFIRIKEMEIDKKRLRLFLSLVVVLGLSASAGLFARIVFASKIYKRESLHYPYDTLTQKIKKEFKGGVMLAENHVIAANLRYYIRNSLAMTPEVYIVPPKKVKTLLLVWEDDKGSLVPPSLYKLIKRLRPNIILKRIQGAPMKALYKYFDKKYHKIYVRVIEEHEKW